jgi:hypothetical protein
MWFIKLLQKRPSDLTIRVIRVIFGLILIFTLYYNLIIQGDKIDNNFFWIDLNSQIVEYITYFFIWVWIMPIIMWITNKCFLKKKYMRIIQGLFGLLLFYIANQIIVIEPVDTDKLNLDFDILIWFMGILPLIAWITGKSITTSCMKFNEKITKIRV